MKKFQRAESELQLLTEEAARAAFYVDRRSELEEVTSKVDEARGQEGYFQDVIHYFNSKLAFFNSVEEALDREQLERQKGEDYEFFQQIQPEKNLLWDMLEDLNNQLMDIQYQISDLEYNEFALKNRFAAEDEAAAQEDINRKQQWLEEVKTDFDAIVT